MAKIGGDVDDRWNRYDGSQPHHPVVSAVEPGPAIGLVFVRRSGCHGFGRAVLEAAVAHPSVQDVRLFAAGIDTDNHASRRCAAAAGSMAAADEPDWGGTVYSLLRRTPSAATQQTHPDQ